MHPPIDWPIPILTRLGCGGKLGLSEPSASCEQILRTAASLAAASISRLRAARSGMLPVADSRMVGGDENDAAPDVMLGFAVILMAADVDVEIPSAVAAARKRKHCYRRRGHFGRIGQKYRRGDVQRSWKRHAGGYVNLEFDRFHTRLASTDLLLRHTLTDIAGLPHTTR